MYLYYRLLLFIFGFAVGLYLAKIVCNDFNAFKRGNRNIKPFTSEAYNNWFNKQQLNKRYINWDQIRYGNASVTLESNYLYEKVPILCLILVKSEKNAQAAKNTWAKSCNQVELVKLPESRKPQIKRNKKQSSWVLLCEKMFTVTNYKWVLIVNDYTFSILENLRYFLAPLNSDQDYYLGHTVTFWGHDYNLGQAGYVLSNGALKKLINKLNNSQDCSKDLTFWNREDFYLGKHLGQINIHPIDTRDEGGFSTFHPYNWYHAFYPGEGHYKLSKYPHICCSNKSVTFQAIEGDKMYTYYYLFYTLQLFINGKYGNKPLPKESTYEVWKAFLKERNIPSDNISPEMYYKVWEDLIDDPNSFAKNMKREESEL